MAEVVALYKYSYVYEGKTITFKKGEKFQLLEKPNGDWWHVRRWHEEGKAEDIYVPANYVKEEKVMEVVAVSPLYENMSDLAASYKKTKEDMASVDGKREKTLPPPVRQKPTRSSFESTEKAHNGHIPRQGQKIAPGTEKETKSPERARKSTFGEANFPHNTHKALEAVAGKPRSKTMADDSSSSLDRSPQETSLDRLPQGTVARLNASLAASVGGGGSDSKAPPPNVKPKPGKSQHAPLSRSSSDAERSAPLFKPSSSASGGEVSTFVPPAPSDMKRPARTHSYEPVTLPITKTPSPDNGDTTSTIPKIVIPSGLAAAIASKAQSVPSSSTTSTVTSTTLTSTSSSSSSLPEGWHETKTEDGRVYYYNSATRDTSWTFPESTTDSPSHQPAVASNDSSTSSSPKKNPTVALEKVAPRGWTKEINPLTQTPIFTNSRTRERWGVASDESGLFYFYNTAQPSVTLRDLPPIMDETAMRSLSEPGESSIYDSLSPAVQAAAAVAAAAPPVQLRVKAPNSESERAKNMEARNSVSYDLWSSRLTTVLKKHGYLQKKRIHDPSGKKLRNEKWVSLFVVLDENKMLFYRDHKSKEAPGAKPLGNFWLLQANISCIPNPKEKKAKNVFQVSSSMGEQFYLAADTPAMMNEWFSVVQTAIDHTNADYKKNPDKYADVVRADLDVHHHVGHAPLGRKASAPVAGYSYDDDNEEESQGPDRTVRIRGRLKKLIARRPEADVLRRTGIMQETVFGCDLSKLTEREKSPVPQFLRHFIEHIEKKGLTVVGLYRLSGNAAEIQKLRYLVEENPFVDLEDPVWADVNIVTGCLKLFLRELPDPLIPFKHFRYFIDAGRNPPAQRVSALVTEVSKLPEANYQTLKTLIIHLRKVVEFGHTNRMQASNLGIVFGPTIMRAETDSLEMATLMPVQNGITELMISEFDKIFKK